MVLSGIYLLGLDMVLVALLRIRRVGVWLAFLILICSCLWVHTDNYYSYGKGI